MNEPLPDLDQFISTALEQIVGGIDASRDSLSKYGAVLNPDVKGKAEDLAAAGILTAMEPSRPVVKGEKPRKMVVRVLFDISIAAEKTKDGGLKLGVWNAVFKAGVKGGVETKGIAEHRVQFEVPLLLGTAKLDA